MTASAPARRGRPRSEVIDTAILDATVAEIIENGFFGISMESVAGRAGVAKTTVYRRWPDATDLGVEALRRLKGPLGEPPEGSAREQILWLAEQMRRVWDNPTFAAAMRRVAAEGTTHPDLFRESRDRLIGPHLRRMDEAIARGQREGLIDPAADRDWVRRLIVAPTLAASFTLQQSPRAAELERTVEAVLRGVAP